MVEVDDQYGNAIEMVPRPPRGVAKPVGLAAAGRVRGPFVADRDRQGVAAILTACLSSGALKNA